MQGETVEIYVGCMPSHELVVRVLEWSVRRHTRRPVRVHRLHARVPAFALPAARANRPGTAFSFQRFTVPEVAGRHGRALYLDCDQIVFKDIGHAFDYPMRGAPVLPTDTDRLWRRKPRLRSSVMLLDCARLDWDVRALVADLDAGRRRHEDLFALPEYRHTLPGRWNSLDRYRRGWTALLHYTAKRHQPWIGHDHPLACLWLRYLLEAVEAGAIAAADVDAAAARGEVRPSLAWQVTHRVADPRRLPAAQREADGPFLAECARYGFNNTPGDYRSATAAAPLPDANAAPRRESTAA
jgi:hypothetical protein